MKNIDIIKKKDLPENAIIKGFTFLKTAMKTNKTLRPSSTETR